MSDHRTCEARFGALFDGDLEAEPRAEVEAHLASCAQCAAAWRTYTGSVAALRMPAVLPPPDSHVAAVMARVAGARAAAAPARRAALVAPGRGAASAAHTAPQIARPRATMPWRALATHVAALAAGALATFALAPLFDARDATPDDSLTTPAAAPAPADDALARASVEHAAALHGESRRMLATALALQEAALAGALAGRDAAEALAAAESARVRAAEATLAGVQVAAVERSAAQRAELERDALRREEARLTAAAELRAEAHRAEAQRATTQRAEAQRAAAEALASVALVRSFERLGETLAQLDTQLVARAGAARRADEAPTPPAEGPSIATSSTHDWQPIDVDAASLAATGRRAEHVLIRREGDRVALSTSGAIDEIVEALLARLDDPDPAVRAAVELRLEDIAAELDVARGGAQRPRKSADEPWWRSDRGQVAALTIGSAGDTHEPWPDWWSRARATVGR